MKPTRLLRSCASISLPARTRSEEHTSELQSRLHLVCRLLLEKKKKTPYTVSATARCHTHLQARLPLVQPHPLNPGRRLRGSVSRLVVRRSDRIVTRHALHLLV